MSHPPVAGRTLCRGVVLALHLQHRPKEGHLARVGRLRGRHCVQEGLHVLHARPGDQTPALRAFQLGPAPAWPGPPQWRQLQKGLQVLQVRPGLALHTPSACQWREQLRLCVCCLDAPACHAWPAQLSADTPCSCQRCGSMPMAHVPWRTCSPCPTSPSAPVTPGQHLPVAHVPRCVRCHGGHLAHRGRLHAAPLAPDQRG